MIIKPYWYIHHAVLLEVNDEPIGNRLRYIRTDKDKSEHKARFRALRPVKRVDLLPRKVRQNIERVIRTCRTYTILEKKWSNHSPIYYGDVVIAYNQLQFAKRLLRHSIEKHHKKVIARHKAEYPKCPCTYYASDFGWHRSRTKKRRMKFWPTLDFSS